MDQSDKVDLLQAFTSWDDCRNMFRNLTQALNNANDAAVAVLALEGLFRIESDVQRGQIYISDEDTSHIRNLLREWRCESPQSWSYSGVFGSVPVFLRTLTIFNTLQVPLFIDDYGTKELLSSYGERIEDIDIDGDTPIFHVTHCEEAQSIVDEKQFKPSDNKNIIEGCWFGLDGKSDSVYGSRAFETTLSQLRVTGLRQGEIVSYKKEVNVILYAVDDTEFKGLKKPTDDAVKDVKEDGYVKVSIFVPSKFLPAPHRFFDVVSDPTKVNHGPFCVREKRSSYECKELFPNE